MSKILYKLSVLLVAVAVLGAACSSASETDATRDDEGNISEADDVGVFRLRAGDCLLLPSAAEQVETIEGVPCSEPHTGEVIDLHVMSEGDDEPFPGAAAVASLAEQVCVDMFDRVTGLDFVTDPDWDVAPLTPTEESWDAINDREIVCIATPLDGVASTTLIPRL